MLVRTLNTYLLSNIDNTFSIERGLKSSSGRFHTRLFACKQPVADVQQARHFFRPRSLRKFYIAQVAGIDIWFVRETITYQSLIIILPYRARAEEFLWLLPHATFRLQAGGR